MAKGELKCLDETGELWLVRREDPGYGLLKLLPKELKSGAVLPERVIQGRSSDSLHDIYVSAYERKIQKLSTLADDPDIEPVLVCLVQLVACLRALRDA